ncbi:MAG: ABC transporter permease [bacterium]|nr:ABC transporter permease [bacterium]
MKTEFFIARRHITRSGGAFRKIISSISIGGVALGVGAMLIAIPIENGFHKSLKDRILTSTPHVVVMRFHHELIPGYKAIISKIKKMEGIKTVEPFISEKGILRNADEQEGAMIRGVDKTEKIPNLTGERDGLILGSILAASLSTTIGDSVTLFSIAANSSRIKTKRYVVSGIFEGGLYEYNSALAYMPLEETQKFFEIGDQITGIEIELHNIYKAPEIAKRINTGIGFPYYATHWIEMNTNLFAALKIEKVTMFLVLLLITIVACFGICVTLIMLIIQKTREIGVLRAMGASAGMIKRIFMLEGVLIGTTGTVIGVIMGFLVSYFLGKFKIIELPPGVYGVDTLPVYMRLIDFIVVSFGAIFISFITSLYPATKAAKLLPADAIRYE